MQEQDKEEVRREPELKSSIKSKGHYEECRKRDLQAKRAEKKEQHEGTMFKGYYEECMYRQYQQ